MKIPEILIKIDVLKLIDYWIKLRTHRRIVTVNGHKYNLKPDKPDKRDSKYKCKITGILPETANLDVLKDSSLIYDQGSLGSCTANMSLGLYRSVLKHKGQPDYDGSRLAQYYNSRTDKSEDTGTSIRDAFKAMNRYGICPEKDWPYVIDKFAQRPPDICYVEGLDHQTIRYENIPDGNVNYIKNAISNGNPVGFGIPVYESFESNEVAKTGIVPMPNRCREQLYGYHAVKGIAYDRDGLWCANSWGSSWGKNGYFMLPWNFVRKYASDIWVLYAVE